MNFIDYCIATKNYSALNAINDYTKSFAFMTQASPVGQANGADDYNQRLEKAVSDWRKERQREGSSAARMPLDITAKKRILAEMEKRTQPRQVSNFARLSVL